MLFIFANNTNPSFSTDDLALCANFFYRRSYFHTSLRSLKNKKKTIDLSYSLFTILPRLSSYGVISTTTRSPGTTRIRKRPSRPARRAKISRPSSRTTRKNILGNASSTLPSTFRICESDFIYLIAGVLYVTPQ